MNNTKTLRVKVNQDVNGLNNLKIIIIKKNKRLNREFAEIYNARVKKTKTNHDCTLISFI